MKKRRWIVAILVASMVVGFAGCKHEESNDSGVKVPEMVKVTGGTVDGTKMTGGVFAGRTVKLSDFYIGKYEVTQEEYASVMAGQKVEVAGKLYSLDDKPSGNKGNPAEGEVQGKRPVETVSWYDAVWYCNALSEKAGLGKAYDITVKKVSGVSIEDAEVKLLEGANGYRLPTEAEWEYAARGGKQGEAAWNYTYAGGNEIGNVDWYDENSGDMTHQVGKKKPNSLGLYDMTGNGAGTGMPVTLKREMAVALLLQTPLDLKLDLRRAPTASAAVVVGTTAPTSVVCLSVTASLARTSAATALVFVWCVPVLNKI